MNKFDCSLHTHVRSLFDAHIKPDALAQRVLELGGKGIAITDHGVLTSIEDYRSAFTDRGLKYIPGVEMYVDGGILGRIHLILLAVNDNGYRGISKIVTLSEHNLQSGFPVITKEEIFNIVKDYKGDIIALSACMQGVLSSIFLTNEEVYNSINKLKTKRENYTSPDSTEYEVAKDVVSGCNITLTEAIEERDETKALAEMKFTKRENAIKKAKEKGEDIENDLVSLNNDKKASEEAKKALPAAKEAVDKAKKSLSNANKILKKLEESVNTYNKISEEIAGLEKEIKSDEYLYDLARKNACEYVNSFGDGYFYAEVQYHGIEKERKCYPLVAKLARELHIPIVATNDVHMLTKSEDEILKRSIQKSLRFGDSYEEITESEKELYLKDNFELKEALLKILPEDIVNEAIDNISAVMDKCNVEFNTGKHYPKYPYADTEKLLREAVDTGLKQKFPEGISKEYKDRIDYELGIIISMGYTDYFLIVKDFLEYGRLLGYLSNDQIEDAPLTIDGLKAFIKENRLSNPGFTVGPGRGSAVGSLACYALDITVLDPLKYNLQFERFLNPERISMPDIDSDFANSIREKCISYVKNKYGENAVCGIITTNAQAPKGSIRIASKYYGFKEKGENLISLGSQIGKSIDKDPYISFDTLVDNSGKPSDKGEITLKDYLKNLYKDNKDALEIIHWATVLEGLFTQYSSHAAGIVISDNDDVSDYVPLKRDKESGMFVTQCDLNHVEDIGLLKFDFLGLKTLDVITETLKSIEKNENKIIDPLKLDLEDSNIYDNIFSKGDTNSVFQFSSVGMKMMLKRFNPSNFEDLIILVSMFRPGPLQYLDDVIEVKKGRKKPEYLCPQLAPILDKTYGAIVYQEQVMEICQKLGGYSLGRADTVRRYMSKKKGDKLAKEKEVFTEGCKKNGISEDVADKLFSQMMDFARYAFNKSHAAVYAYNAYITAWLKYYYPVDFYTSALNWEDMSKIPGLIYEATKRGIKVLNPSVNNSDVKFTRSENNIIFGLSNIKGVNNSAKQIVSYRNEHGLFFNIDQFLDSVKLDNTSLENLIDAGALDCFNNNRSAIKKYIKDTEPYREKIKEKNSFLASAEYVLPKVEQCKTNEELVEIQKTAGLKAEIKTLTTAENLTNRINTAQKTISQLISEKKCITLSTIRESRHTRLLLEKEVLGLYLSDHPLNSYPTNEDMGLPVLIDITEDTGAIYGLVTKIDVRKRKKDGQEMAILKVEDKTRSIDVLVFVKEYAILKDKIQSDHVYKIYGNVNVDEDSESEDTEYKFVLKKIEEVDEISSSIVLKVSSYAVFHAYYEDTFREKYETENGHGLYIYDESTGELRKMLYSVKEKVAKLPNTKELS